MLWGSAAITMGLCVQALAQSTTLPQVTVEGKAQKKGTATKGAPKAAPTQPVEQAQPVQTQEATEKAKKDAVYNTPAAVSTATKSDIDTFGQVDTGDLLRAMPGTSTQESPRNSGLAVNIRGFEGSGRVNMMIDGVRQNFRFTAHEAKGFMYVDPALLAGIDIMRGAVSTVGGAGALVGTANVLTLGVDDIVKPGKTVGAMSTISYGTNGVGWSEMLAGGAKAGAFGVAGAISYHDSHDYKNGSGVTFTDTGKDLLSYLFKMDIRLSAEQSLKLGAVMYDNDFIAQSVQQNVTTSTYTAKYNYKPIGNPLIDFTFNAYANEVEMSYYLGSGAGRVINDQGVGFDASNTSRFKFGALKVASTYGYEFFFDDVDAKNKFTTAAGGVNPAGEATIGGVFWQTQYSLGVFDLITGLRYDTYSLKGTYDVDGPGPGGLASLDQSDERLSPKVTLAAQVTPWLQPYVTYSEAFRAPTLNETMFGGDHPGSVSSNFLPNPFLKPEVQRGWEFGANIKQDNLFARGDHFRLKAAYYQMNVEDYIIGVGSVTGAPPPVFAIVNGQFVNLPGSTRVQGVEVEASYDAGMVFGGLSYTYTDSELPAMFSGLGAPGNLPYHIAVGTFGVRLLDQKLTIGTRVSYYSDWNVGINNVGSPNAGGSYASQFMPSYTLVDLFTSYKVTDNFELGLIATNLFDVSYTPAGSTATLPPGGTPLAAFNSSNCFGSNFAGCTDSGKGRTVLFTARSHF